MKLKDKVAVITGGAMGNGLGITKIFLKYGAKVIILDNSEELPKTVESLSKEYSKEKIIGCQVDIRDDKKLIKIAKTISEQNKHIDILVNNAGVCRLSSFKDTSNELRDFQFDINIKGTWNTTKAFLPYMGAEQQSSIINLSSVTGPMVADSGEVAYATTKAALIGFTKALAADLIKDNIRVNAILPGYIKTPMVENMSKVTNPDNPNQVIDEIEAGIPMGRMGTIEEVGELAAFLASDESSYITAQGIVIDGASTLPETNSMGV